MHPLDRQLVCRLDLSRLVAVDAVEPIGPGELSGGEVQLEAADAGYPLGLGEQRLHPGPLTLLVFEPAQVADEGRVPAGIVTRDRHRQLDRKLCAVAALTQHLAAATEDLLVV